MVKVKNLQYRKKHVIVNPLRTLPPCKHTGYIILATLWSSSRNLFPDCLYLHCHGCLRALNGFKMFAFHGHLDFGEDPEVTYCKIRWMRCVRAAIMFSWACTAVGWQAVGSSHCIFHHNYKDTIDRGFAELHWKVARVMGQKS